MKYMLVLLNLILLLQPVTVFSQVTTGSLRGTVTDKQGVLIPNAKVVATFRETLATGVPHVFETKTNDEGRFNIKHLPFGRYDVRVSLEGSEAQIERLVSVPEGASVDDCY